jgi:hypothetical protein
MRVDVPLHRVVDPRKAFLGESDRFGFDRCPARGRPAKANRQRPSVRFRCIANSLSQVMASACRPWAINAERDVEPNSPFWAGKLR